MNREEYAFAYNINSTGMSGIITMTNPPKLVCYCDEENSKTILNALNPPLPPAEGAEKPNAMKFLSDNGYGSGFNYTTNQVAYLMQEFAAQQQPTAEGAEEILNSLYDFMKPFFTEVGDYCRRGHTLNGRKMDVNQIYGILGRIKKAIADREHAQRIADKMVAENLVEFGNMIRDEPNGDIAALAEYFIRTINLKAREK